MKLKSLYLPAYFIFLTNTSIIQATPLKPCDYVINIDHVLIRCARPQDADQLLPLMQQLIGYPQSLKSLEDRLVTYLTSPQYHVFVAEVDNVLVGLVAVYVTHRFIVHGKRCTIEALVVDELCRGHGVGRKLMHTVELFAKNSGCSLIDLVTGIQRTEAHLFYQKMGYRHAGQQEKLYFTKKV
jgi:ribosomal protein S18 acetylase RimI-like enzyme